DDRRAAAPHVGSGFARAKGRTRVLPFFLPAEKIVARHPAYSPAVKREEQHGQGDRAPFHSRDGVSARRGGCRRRRTVACVDRERSLQRVATDQRLGLRQRRRESSEPSRLRGRSTAMLQPVRDGELIRLRGAPRRGEQRDRKSTRLNSSHVSISYAVFCLKKKNRH